MKCTKNGKAGGHVGLFLCRVLGPFSQVGDTLIGGLAGGVLSRESRPGAQWGTQKVLGVCRVRCKTPHKRVHHVAVLVRRLGLAVPLEWSMFFHHRVPGLLFIVYRIETA